MPWAPIRLTPGLNVELTPTANQTGYSSTTLGRFKNGLFQKLGGWTKYFVNAVDSGSSAIHGWQDLLLNKRVAVGGSTGLWDITLSTVTNVSPQIKTTNTATNFATTIGSPIVTIVDTNVSNITLYDSVYFNTPISVGGIILSGIYRVAANISPTSYTINAGINATSTDAAPGGDLPTFTTAAGSANITVTFPNHGLVVGDDIVFPITFSVGGVVIFGRYFVNTVIGVNQFVITTVNSAYSTVGPAAYNGNLTQLRYYIAIGPQVSGVVYGAGDYGAGTYGFGTSISGQTGTDVGSSSWHLDNWGELLIATPENGGIYYWGPASGYANTSLITEGPIFNIGAFVSISQQVVVAYGSTQEATSGVYQDPLLVRWCDVGNFADWTATIVNQAGSYRIPTGSLIVAGAATPHRNLIWTDADLWSMDYVGATFAFGFSKIGSNCGLIAKHAFTQLADTTYWMGTKSFFALSGGGVQQLPCPIWDAVFQDLDTANASKCFAAANPSFSEILFFYPSLSGGLGYCDKYAKFNVMESAWDTGSLQRHAWVTSSVVGYPLSTDYLGIIYKHEDGLDADGAALSSGFDTGWFYIDEGREIVFVDRIIPDFRWGLFNGSQNAHINVTIKTVMYPGETPTVYGPFEVTQASQYISKRFRARQVMLNFSSNDMGSFWRLGAVRVRWSPDGRR